MKKLKAILCLLRSKTWILYTDGTADWDKATVQDVIRITETLILSSEVSVQQRANINEVNNILNNQ